MFVIQQDHKGWSEGEGRVMSPRTLNAFSSILPFKVVLASYIDKDTCIPIFNRRTTIYLRLYTQLIIPLKQDSLDKAFMDQGNITLPSLSASYLYVGETTPTYR